MHITPSVDLGTLGGPNLDDEFKIHFFSDNSYEYEQIVKILGFLCEYQAGFQRTELEIVQQGNEVAASTIMHSLATLVAHNLKYRLGKQEFHAKIHFCTSVPYFADTATFLRSTASIRKCFHSASG